MSVVGFTKRRSPMSFVSDFKREVDRATFAFIMTDDQRARWAKMEGASPWQQPGRAALIVAGLR